jgi:hypothetical protein
MSPWLLCHVFWYNFTHVSEVLSASITILMMEASSTSKTLVNFYQTAWHNNPEYSHLNFRELQKFLNKIFVNALQNISEN